MMRLIHGLAVGAFALALSAPMAAADTVTGDLIDAACYTKQGANALEDGHAKSCGVACAKKGLPMVIVADGKIYEIAGDYTNDNNAKLIELVGETVEATGEVHEADGKTIIHVTALKAVD